MFASREGLELLFDEVRILAVLDGDQPLQDHDAAQASAGAAVFADNCASCHGEAGKGDRTQGAPNLTDAIWLYGGSAATLTETVSKARFGVMPAWSDKLSEDEIRAVATYVHSLGGGE